MWCLKGLGFGGVGVCRVSEKGENKEYSGFVE